MSSELLLTILCNIHLYICYFGPFMYQLTTVTLNVMSFLALNFDLQGKWNAPKGCNIVNVVWLF